MRLESKVKVSYTSGPSSARNTNSSFIFDQQINGLCPRRLIPTMMTALFEYSGTFEIQI